MIDITKCPLALILNKIVRVFQCMKNETLSIVKYRESHYVTVLDMYEAFSIAIVKKKRTIIKTIMLKSLV